MSNAQIKKKKSTENKDKKKERKRSNRKWLALQFSDGENLDAFDWINDVFRIGCQFGDSLLKVEHFFGKFRRLQTGGA